MTRKFYRWGLLFLSILAVSRMSWADDFRDVPPVEYSAIQSANSTEDTILVSSGIYSAEDNNGVSYSPSLPAITMPAIINYNIRSGLDNNYHNNGNYNYGNNSGKNSPSISASAFISVNKNNFIQSAINAAQSGDTIIVSAPQVYTENLVFTKKALTVVSSGYGAVIDGSTIPSPAVTFTSGSLYSTVVLNGFIIRNGTNGIRVIEGSRPFIINNIIYSNTASGIYCDNSSPIIINNTIVSNTAVTSGGGIYAVNNSALLIINTIVWSNINGEIYTSSSFVTVTHSDIRGSFTGDGNINANPHFMDAASRDYRLQEDSPCIDAGISDDSSGIQSPADDINRNDRPVFAGWDIGADESRKILLTKAVSTGSKVRTVLSNSPVNSANAPVIIFDTVTNPGQVIFSGIKSASLPSGIPPIQGSFFLNGTSNYSILSTYYTVRASQGFHFIGKAAVAFHYDDTNMLPSQEQRLHLLHYNNGHWEDITTSVSIQSNIIHGNVTSLSPFVIILAAPSSSSTSSGDSGGGHDPSCFIATAAFGTPFAREVQILRNFRDAYLLTNTLGQKFVSLYYRFSPPIADFIRGNSFLRAIVRTMLRPIIWLVQIFCPQCSPDIGTGLVPAPNHL